MVQASFDVTALGELLIDFTENGLSGQGNPLFEANPGGAPCNVLAIPRSPRPWLLSRPWRAGTGIFPFTGTPARTCAWRRGRCPRR